jgi:multidrug resistance efflux pump
MTQTVEQRNQLWTGRLDANLAAADAEIAAARSQELTTRQIHDDMMKCKEVELPDGSTKKICPTLGTYEERARFEWHAALAALAAAEANKDVLEPEHWAEAAVAGSAIDAAEEQVALAEAREAQARADVRPVDVAVAQAGVAQAKAALAAANLNLDHTVVRAPIAGTVGAVDIRLGQFAAPGTPVITLGDLATLRVETTDLDEIDVGRVVLGQSAVVTFDALPDRTFDAAITHIAPVAASTGGGVNYTVILELDELDPVLRWGMTAFVDITTE